MRAIHAMARRLDGIMVEEDLSEQSGLQLQ